MVSCSLSIVCQTVHDDDDVGCMYDIEARVIQMRGIVDATCPKLSQTSLLPILNIVMGPFPSLIVSSRLLETPPVWLHQTLTKQNLNLKE